MHNTTFILYRNVGKKEMLDFFKLILNFIDVFNPKLYALILLYLGHKAAGGQETISIILNH